MKLLPLSLLALLPLSAYSSPTQTAVDAAIEVGSSCDCSGTQDGGRDGRNYICRDKRLGPKRLPRMIPLSNLVSSYDRFGGLTPGEFLEKWTDATGNYKYPPLNGFQLDTNGNAINGTMLLQTGTLVDRFGSEYGSYLDNLISRRKQHR